MQSTRVAAVSMNGLLGQPERVLAAIDGWCEKAAAEGVHLVLFPELVVHGHCTPNTWDLAEPVPEGPSTRALVEVARSRDEVNHYKGGKDIGLRHWTMQGESNHCYDNQFPEVARVFALRGANVLLIPRHD
jgi:predicted amidohydrolase